jgi:predicted DNA-binding transcriptional regulator YafY
LTVVVTRTCYIGKHDYLLSPDFIEPSAVGYATHVIGYSSYWNDIRTFKLERVRRAELTEDTFDVPEDFDPLKLLGTAWGIMFGDAVVEVRLRFSPEVTRRVRESRWHEGEEVEDLDNGGCLYMVRVAHPLEMKWWIRSWGPNVEVLAPEALRREMAEEARRVVEVYEARIP